MTEKNENKKVMMDLISEDTERFGYVPPNRMTTQDDIEKRGYVPPAIERHPTPMNSSDSSTDSNQSSAELPEENDDE